MKVETYLKAQVLKEKIDFCKQQIAIWKDSTDATMPKMCLCGITVDVGDFLKFGELRNIAITHYKKLVENYEAEFDKL